MSALRSASTLRFLPWLGTVFATTGLASASALADHPACDQIQHSCGEAGFTRDLPEGRDLMTKCFDPIMKGQEVAGVKVDPDLIKKCASEQKGKPSQGRKRRRGGM